MRPSEEFYRNLIAMRNLFNNDALLLDVAKMVQEMFQEYPDTTQNRCRLQVIAAMIKFLEEVRN